MNEATRALYEAHVAHELAGLAEREHGDYFEQLSRSLFEWLSVIKLDELLTREQVLGVIDRYVIELRISGGIAELVGHIAQLIISSNASADTRIDQLLSYESYRSFADKVQSLDGAFREVILLITRARSLPPLLARTAVLASRSLLTEHKGKPARVLPEKLALLARKLREELAARFEEQLVRYLESHADELARATEAHLHELLDSDIVRSLADELWDAVSSVPLSELFSLLSPTDMEDFVVLGYENWLQYRQTPYFRTTCAQVVDVFFSKYGAESVHGFLDDMGVTESMVAHELRALVGPMLTPARRGGFLEQQVRARLEPFYRSSAAARLLDGARAPRLTW